MWASQVGAEGAELARNFGFVLHNPFPTIAHSSNLGSFYLRNNFYMCCAPRL